MRKKPSFDEFVKVLEKVEYYNKGLTGGNPTELFRLVRYTQFEPFGRASESDGQYWIVEIGDQSKADRIIKVSKKYETLYEALKFLADELGA